MKYKHIVTGLIALSLVAVAFVATVSATEIFYPPNTIFEKTKGKYFTWTIITTGDPLSGFPGFSGLDLKEETVWLHFYDTKGNPFEIQVGASNIDTTADTIVIHLTANDVPNHGGAYHIVGDLTTGDSFYASGPGWGWANIH